MGAFTDRVVFITGASSGIGEALALELARRGADVALAARRTDRLERLARELKATGRRALALACDVSREGDVEAAVTRVAAELGPIDVLVANAGFAVTGKLTRPHARRLPAPVRDQRVRRHPLDPRRTGPAPSHSRAPGHHRQRQRIRGAAGVLGLRHEQVRAAGAGPGPRRRARSRRGVGDAHQPRLRRHRDPPGRSTRRAPPRRPPPGSRASPDAGGPGGPDHRGRGSAAAPAPRRHAVRQGGGLDRAAPARAAALGRPHLRREDSAGPGGSDRRIDTRG